jgi:hypothetical protein
MSNQTKNLENDDFLKLCTSLACPLYPYRPYKQGSKKASESVSFVAESKNSG